MNKSVILVSAVALLSGCTSDNPREIVRRAGYMTTVPPTTSYGPGNIVWKRANVSNAKDDVSLGYICSPEYVKLPGDPEKSGTEISDFGSSKEFSFSGDNLKSLGLDSSAQYISNLTVKFSNIEYQEYALDKVGMIESGLGKECTKILKKQLVKKNAYIVRAAFKADLDYKVTYKASANSSVKAKVIKEVQGKFGISIAKNEGRVGRGLFYGVDLAPLF